MPSVVVPADIVVLARSFVERASTADPLDDPVNLTRAIPLILRLCREIERLRELQREMAS